MHTSVLHQYCPMCDKLPRIGEEELNSVHSEPFLILCFEESADCSPALSTGRFKEATHPLFLSTQCFMACGECELSLKIKIVTKNYLPSEQIRKEQHHVNKLLLYILKGGGLRQLCELIYFRHIKKLRFQSHFCVTVIQATILQGQRKFLEAILSAY